jgi:DNA polymerase III alpha subunit
MPELPFPKSRPHPVEGLRADRAGAMAEASAAPKGDEGPGLASGGASGLASDLASGLGSIPDWVPACRPALPRYAELETRSNFSFLVGASHPDELVARAFELGHVAACIADTNTLAGVVRAHVAAKRIREQAGGATTATDSMRRGAHGAVAPLAVGCRLLIADPPGLTLLAYPTHRAAYARLCRLLTIGKRRVGKGCCSLSLHDLLEQADGMHLVLVPPKHVARWAGAQGLAILDALRRRCGDLLSIAAHRLFDADDDERGVLLKNLAAVSGVPLAACNDVHYHDASRRPLQDVLLCIREGCTIAEAGRRLFPHAERRLKSPLEMARLFAASPIGEAALERSAEIARAAAEGFSLDELRYEYPDEVVPEGRADRARTRAHRRARLRALLPHRLRHRPLRAVKGHPVPGARLGRQLRRLLLPRRDRGRPEPDRPPLRALRLKPSARTARHRRRLRARAARGSHPVHLQSLRPRSRRRSPPP